LPWMCEIFYGVGAAVIGIISISAYKLTLKSVGKLNLANIKSNWLLWLFYLIAVVATVITQQEEVALFIGCGLLYVVIKAPPTWIKRPNAFPILFFSNAGFWNYSKDTLEEIGLFFLKAGAFVFGSGLAIVPFLHAGVVNEYQWLNENQFVDAIAVAMVTPGPVVITVGFIG